MNDKTIELKNIHLGTHLNSTNKTTEKHTVAFHALIIADLCGEHNNIKPFPLFVDRDNYTSLLAEIKPQIKLEIGQNNTEISISINSLEDFAPDALFKSIPLFEKLRILRDKLQNPDTFNQAAKALGAVSNDSKNNTSEFSKPNERSNDALELLLSATEQRQASLSERDNIAQTIIKEIISPYIIPAPDARQDELIATVDNSISELMRQILHHKKFKKLEATWRSIFLLVQKTETSTNLKYFLYHANKTQFLQDFSDNEILQSKFFKNAIEPFTSVAGKTPWSVVLADFEFEPNVIDICLADILCQLSASSNASLLAQVSSSFIGCDDIVNHVDSDDWTFENSKEFDNAWQALRQQDYSHYLGLCFPHFLLRTPYGKQTKPVEEFSFEEMTQDEHSNYLWGNSAYLVTLLLAQSYTHYGWQFKPGKIRQIDQLPTCFYLDEFGDKSLKPTAEILLSESGALCLVEHGLLPIWSVADSDHIRVGPFNSACEDNLSIKGRWL